MKKHRKESRNRVQKLPTSVRIYRKANKCSCYFHLQKLPTRVRIHWICWLLCFSIVIPDFAQTLQAGEIPRLFRLVRLVPVPDHLEIAPFKRSLAITDRSLWLYPGSQLWAQSEWLYIYHFDTRQWDSVKIAIRDSLLMRNLLDAWRVSVDNAIPALMSDDTLVIVTAGMRMFLCTIQQQPSTGEKILVRRKERKIYSSLWEQPVVFPDAIVLLHHGIGRSQLYDSSHTLVERYDLRTDSLQRIFFPDPEGFWFLYFYPPYPPDVCSWGIAVSEITRYRIRFYNWDGTLHSVLEHPHERWNGSALLRTLHDTLLSTVEEQGGVAAIRMLRPLFYRKVNSIQRAAFLNDSLLLVIWWQQDTIPETPVKRIADLWQLQSDGQWRMIAGNIALPRSIEQARESPIPLWSTWFVVNNGFILLPGEMPGTKGSGIFIWSLDPQAIRQLRQR